MMNISHWKDYILSCIWGPLLVAQFILVLFLGFYNEAGISVLLYIGWIIWVLSIIFGWLPIFVLKKQGGVDKGKSYVHTKTLVTTGIYAIVRHPQYTAGILFSLALILILPVSLVTSTRLSSTISSLEASSGWM